jgi:hypothetical protein
VREDIAKQICERPRVGGGRVRSRRAKLNRIDGETDPKGESMARRRLYGYASKEFSDFLEPLKGFLRKSVGRPWDKIYSEMAALLPKDTTTGRHVWTHVDGFVERQPIFDAGRVYRSGGSRRYGPSELGRGDLYVSEHGLLLRYRKTKRSYAERAGILPTPTACQLVSPTEGYVKQGGVWWFATFEIVRDVGVNYTGRGVDVCGVSTNDTRPIYGSFKGDPAPGGIFGLFYRRAISKSRMSKSDVRQLILLP